MTSYFCQIRLLVVRIYNFAFRFGASVRKLQQLNRCVCLCLRSQFLAAVSFWILHAVQVKI